jgi:hypothetical protein
MSCSEEVQRAALGEIIPVVAQIAAKHGVCPTCMANQLERYVTALRAGILIRYSLRMETEEGVDMMKRFQQEHPGASIEEFLAYLAEQTPPTTQ